MNEHSFSREDIQIISKLAGREVEQIELDFLWETHPGILDERIYFETFRRLDLGAKRDTRSKSFKIQINESDEFLLKSSFFDKNSDLEDLNKITLSLCSEGFIPAIQARMHSGKPKRRISPIYPVSDIVTDLTPKEFVLFSGGVKKIRPEPVHRPVHGHFADLFLVSYNKLPDAETCSTLINQVYENEAVLSSHWAGEGLAKAIYLAWEQHSTGFEINKYYGLDTGAYAFLICVKPGNEKDIKKRFKGEGWSVLQAGKLIDSTDIEIHGEKDKPGFTLPAATFKFLHHLPEKHRSINVENNLTPVTIKKIGKDNNYTKTALELYKMVKENHPGEAVTVSELTGDHNIVVSVPYNASWCSIDPRNGGRIAVATAVRELVCTGYAPFGIGIHNILPKGISKDSWKGIEVTQGQEEAIRFFKLPVLSRDHSTSDTNFNQIVGVFGNIRRSNLITRSFKNDGDFISILGSHRGELGGSSYLELTGELSDEHQLPALDLSMDQRLHDVIQTANSVGLVKSAINIAAGGLAVAILKSLENADQSLGARVFFSRKLLPEEILFGETQGLIMVTLDEREIMEFERICIKVGVPSTTIGRVTGDEKILFNDQMELTRTILKKQG